MRTKLLIAASFLSMAICRGQVRADVVHDGRAPFENVEILGLFDQELKFKTKDARTLTRPAAELRYIALEDVTESAKNLTAAERSADRTKTVEAIDLYDKVRAAEKTGWMGAFATMRLAQLNDKRGAFNPAFEAWLSLTANYPKLAKSLVPKRVPTGGTKAGQEALALIVAAEKTRQPADVVAALAKMRKQIGDEKPEAGKPRETVGKPTAKGNESVSRARSAINSGDLDLAGKVIATGKASAKKPDMAEWLLVEAEYEFARKSYDRAALAAMRIVALHPDAQQVGPALMMAGRAYESLGRASKSIQLYEEVIKTKGVPATVKDEAQSRLASLRKATSTP